MDSRLLRRAFGIVNVPEGCVLNEIRERLLSARGKPRKGIGIFVDKTQTPMRAFGVDLRGRSFSVLPKAWPIYVEAGQLESLLVEVVADCDAALAISAPSGQAFRPARGALLAFFSSEYVGMENAPRRGRQKADPLWW